MNNAKFVKAYLWAYKNDKTSLDIAKKLGWEVQRVYVNANYLRKKGVRLPYLNRESGRRMSVEDLNGMIAKELAD